MPFAVATRDFEVGGFVKLRLHKRHNTPGVSSHKTGRQSVRPFGIIEGISNLAYQLKLLELMLIYSVVNVAMLESSLDSRGNDQCQWHSMSMSFAKLRASLSESFLLVEINERPSFKFTPAVIMTKFQSSRSRYVLSTCHVNDKDCPFYRWGFVMFRKGWKMLHVFKCRNIFTETLYNNVSVLCTSWLFRKGHDAGW